MQRKYFVAGALFAGAAAVLAAQDKPVQNPPDKKPEGVLVAPQPPRDIIRRSVDLVTNTVIVRDPQGQFVANLGKNDFEVYEDGVKQDLITFVLTHGGRVLNDVSAPPPPVQEGILLPPPRPTNDASGRIFLILVDDLHMDFRNTGRIRDLFKKISKELVHDGDMFAIVSTGPSSIAIDATYDRKRLDEAISKISGSGLKPDEIISTPDGSQGPPEVRYRAHVAFSTAYEVLQKMESVHNRRKAFIYVSNGYDFDPFSKSRAKESNQRYSQMQGSSDGTDGGQTSSETNPFSKGGNEFAAADLA
jgi:VWFA-related protein